MKDPSRDQIEAITHLNGPAELIAGPGSGKTYTILKRIISLISDYNINPNHILVVTFSNASANQMKDRFESSSDYSGVYFCTFHSLAFMILRDYFGYNHKSLLLDAEKRVFLSNAFNRLEFQEFESFDLITEIINRISRSKNCEGNNAYEAINIKNGFTKEMEDAVIKEYKDRISEFGKIDFDDMILNSYDLLLQNNMVLEDLRKRFKYIIIDEFQDINKPQYNLMTLISKPYNNIMAVGDDDQSIYKFRGSTAGSLKMFADTYPELKVIYLTENYRSGNKIVEFATKVINQGRDRLTKKFNPVNAGGEVYFNLTSGRREEEACIIDVVKENISAASESIAIILRTNYEVMQYKSLLNRHGLISSIDKIKGADIKNTEIFKDILAFYNYIYNGKQRKDFLIFMNKPQRYISRQALGTDDNIMMNMLSYYKFDSQMHKMIENIFAKLSLAESKNPITSLNIFLKVLEYEKYLHKEKEQDLQALNEIKKAIEECPKDKDIISHLINYNSANEILDDYDVQFIPDSTLVQNIYDIVINPYKEESGYKIVYSNDLRVLFNDFTNLVYYRALQQLCNEYQNDYYIFSWTIPKYNYNYPIYLLPKRAEVDPSGNGNYYAFIYADEQSTGWYKADRYNFKSGSRTQFNQSNAQKLFYFDSDSEQMVEFNASTWPSDIPKISEQAWLNPLPNDTYHNYRLNWFTNGSVHSTYLFMTELAARSFSVGTPSYYESSSITDDHSVSTSTINSNNSTSYQTINNYYNQYYQDNNRYPSADELKQYITVIVNNGVSSENNPNAQPTPTPGGSGGNGGSDDDGFNIFDFLGDILGGLLDGLGGILKGLASLITSLLEALLDALLSLFEMISKLFHAIVETIPTVFSDFFKALLGWLPDDIINLITLSITAFILIGLFKLIRG